MSVVVGDIRKNLDVIIRVTAKSSNGHAYLDIRVNFLSREGRWVPMRRGVKIDPAQIEELRKLLQEGKKWMDNGKQERIRQVSQ